MRGEAAAAAARSPGRVPWRTGFPSSWRRATMIKWSPRLLFFSSTFAVRRHVSLRRLLKQLAGQSSARCRTHDRFKTRLIRLHAVAVAADKDRRRSLRFSNYVLTGDDFKSCVQLTSSILASLVCLSCFSPWVYLTLVFKSRGKKHITGPPQKKQCYATAHSFLFLQDWRPPSLARSADAGSITATGRQRNGKQGEFETSVSGGRDAESKTAKSRSKRGENWPKRKQSCRRNRQVVLPQLDSAKEPNASHWEFFSFILFELRFLKHFQKFKFNFYP